MMAAMDDAWPTTTVTTGEVMKFIVSKIPSPDHTFPPAEVMYIVIGAPGSLCSSVSNCAMISFAQVSSMTPHR